MVMIASDEPFCSTTRPAHESQQEARRPETPNHKQKPMVPGPYGKEGCRPQFNCPKLCLRTFPNYVQCREDGMGMLGSPHFPHFLHGPNESS